MALAYTAPTWEDGSGTGISASQLQALCNCMEGLVQGQDKAVADISMNASVITMTFADGTQETATATNMKSISSIAKTGSAGDPVVDTYTITYTDGTTSTFTVTNGAAGQAPVITMTATADALSSDNPTVIVTKTGTDSAPNFALAFSGLKGAKGDKGDKGDKGNTGTTPSITASASISGGTGTPAVSVAQGGTAAQPTIDFEFINLKGETGATGATGQTGATGATPDISMSATVDGNVGTPSVSVTKGGTAENPTFALAFSNMKGAKGDTGATGQTGATGATGADGYSPSVTIGTITGGHSVTITDKDHPTGQTFNVMDGQGAGDMLSSDYDPQGTVATAGGIVAYIEDVITDALTASY